jgi:hypothetical protein
MLVSDNASGISPFGIEELTNTNHQLYIGDELSFRMQPAKRPRMQSVYFLASGNESGLVHAALQERQ